MLIEAIEIDNLELIKAVIEAGADVHARDDHALRLTSENGHDAVVRLLLEAGADVHVDNDYALRWASENGHEAVVQLLKQHMRGA